MLPPPRKPIILAEIFMSGLLEPKFISQENQPEKQWVGGKALISTKLKTKTTD
jgi:hypothetical protein